MKKRNIIFSLLSIFLVCNVVAQQRIGDILDSGPGVSNMELFTGGGSSEIKGSPFLFDEWYNGEIKTKLGTLYTDIKIKYAAYSDQLFFLTEDGSERMIAREKIFYFTFNDEKGNNYLFEHIPYQGYLRRLTNGERVVLYKKLEKEIKKAPQNNGYNASTGKDEFISREAYYMKVGEEVVRVDNKGDLLKYFPDQSKELEDFIKKNKVRFKKDDRMIELASFANSLGK